MFFFLSILVILLFDVDYNANIGSIILETNNTKKRNDFEIDN